MDVQTEQRAVIKFSLHLKKPIPCILAPSMEAYKNGALKPSAIQNGTNFVSDKEVVNTVHTFFNCLDRADFQKTNVDKWEECMKQYIRLKGQYFEKASTLANESNIDVSDL